MNIVFFNHPAYLGYVSIARYTKLLAEGMAERGHQVQVWSPDPFFVKLSESVTTRKWLGYIDQYVLFPLKIRKYIIRQPSDTLYVFTDNSQGPWISSIRNRKYIIHCHDFLAQKSARDEIEENPINWTGKIYQKIIFKGYSRSKNFISISYKTRKDLHELLEYNPAFSTVIYNSISDNFKLIKNLLARQRLKEILNIKLDKGYILHVGGNQWYKNRIGVIEIYDAWRYKNQINLPLILVGEPLVGKVLDKYNNSVHNKNIHILYGIDDKFLNLLYSGASTLLFPSLAEGFGWPIAEAMTCGCPVVTTDEAPMTEVAGQAAFLIARRPIDNVAVSQWAVSSSQVLNRVLLLSPSERENVIEKGFEQVKKFDKEMILTMIEKAYSDVY